MKQKVLTCQRCAGRGVCQDAASKRCPDCSGRGWVAVPMTRADRIRDMTDEEMAALLLKLARSALNEDGDLFALWCDDQGGCQEMPEEEMESFCCTDEMHMACILRYLQAPGEDGVEL